MSRSPRCGYADSPDGWDITECIRILFRHRAVLLWITGVGVLAAGVLTYAQPRVYQSRALLELRTLNENFLHLRNIYPAVAAKIDSALSLQTQVELLQQDSLLKEVARKLHLEDRPEFQPPSTLLGKLREDIKIMPLRNTRIIQIVCDARDSTLAADLANTLAGTFIEQGIDSRQRGARQTYQSLQSQVEALRQGLPQETPYESTQSGLRWGGSLLTREAGANQHLYKMMLQQANDARTASVVPQSNIELIAPADPPIRPIKPNLPLNITIGVLDGLVLAIGLVMLHEQNAQVFRAPGEAENLLALPELGAIPSARSCASFPLTFLASGREKTCAERAVRERRSSCLAESFRVTLTSILSSTGDHSQIVVVTSSRPKEGKTTAVSNLGCALAEIGRKTLLIDGDPRRPQLQRIFDQPSEHAVSDFSDRTNAIDLPLHALVKETTVPHLFLMASGAYSGFTLGLSRTDQISRWLQRFRKEFDYVLVDTPPCLEFAGARNLARYGDGLVLVVRANYTERRAVQAAVEQFESDGFRVMGVILNRWDPPLRDGSLAFFGARESDWNCRL